jgi:predicted RNA-binding protein YlxR (DUF448 family)
VGEPVRTCAGCRRRAPKRELVRFVSAGGVLTHDRTGRAPGRGVYTCAEPACFERARQRRAFARALRAPVEVPAGLQSVCERG